MKNNTQNGSPQESKTQHNGWKFFFLILAVVLAMVGWFQLDSKPKILKQQERRSRLEELNRKKEYVQKVNWKHIAAGVAAAGTIIAVYKISDGVRKEWKEQQKKIPKHFWIIPPPSYDTLFFIFLASSR